MEDIIKKVYSHYLSDKQLLEKEKEILMLNDLKKFDFKGRNIDLYYNENYFIKIDHRNEDQQKYKLEDKNLMLGKFPKEIIINNILRKELEANIVKINNYYFNDTKQILVMENAGITFKDLIINEKDNLKLINEKIYEIMIILSILQHKFKFMHKDLKTENIIMKKSNDEFNSYMVDNKEYKIKSYGYIPVFIDLATSTIFKINNEEFEIYDIMKSTYVHNTNKFNGLISPKDFLNKYLWYIRDVNIYNPSFDLYNLLTSINLIIDISKIKIVKDYFEINRFDGYMYSKSLMSPSKFISAYKYNENIFGGESDSESENETKSSSEIDEVLDIDNIVKNKDNSRICILKNGLGNKLFIIANIVNKYKKYQLYFAEEISIHQINNNEKMLIDIFPEIKNCKNPKLISNKNYDILKNYFIPEINYGAQIYSNVQGFIDQKEFLKKYLMMNNYKYLSNTNKYDFENGIFVHIRYGDKFNINYNTLKKNTDNYFFTLLDPSYYIDNINKMLLNNNNEKIKIYVFSDSINIVKCAFENKINNLIYCDANVYETFYCFTQCKKLIISESNLSLSAIYLNYNKDLQVIAPNFSSNNKREINPSVYEYPKNVKLENNKIYFLKDLKKYEDMIKNCSNSEFKLINDNVLSNNFDLKNIENSRLIILKNGLGNKLFTIANIINQYKKYQIYFAEQISEHQKKNSEKKLKYVFTEMQNRDNPKIISFTEFDILKKKNIKEIKYDESIYVNNNGFINQNEYLKKYLKMDSSYDYLLDKYDFENGIFVHVRYGDKFKMNYDSLKSNKQKIYSILFSPEYYINNINKFMKDDNNKPIYIFSDSNEIVKNIFNSKFKNITCVNEGTYETFFCFTHCKKLIISDSTISIAAIYLNYNKDFKAIAPNFTMDYNNHKIVDLKYKFPSNVILENDKSYILQNIKQYEDIIKSYIIKK